MTSLALLFSFMPFLIVKECFIRSAVAVTLIEHPTQRDAYDNDDDTKQYLHLKYLNDCYMNKDEFIEQLTTLGFTKQRESEYNRDYYQNDAYEVDDLRDYPKFTASLVVLVDYYNITVRWFHQPGKRVSKSYSVYRDLLYYEDVKTLLRIFMEYCIDTFSVKPV